LMKNFLKNSKKDLDIKKEFLKLIG